MPKRRTCIRTTKLVPILILAAMLAALTPASAQDPPNIVIFLIDDAGVEEFDFFGLRDDPEDPEYADTDYITDTLVADGSLFTNAWSTPLCSPTRAAIMTGKFPFRTGIGTVVQDETIYGLDVDDTNNLAHLMASTAGSTTGYATYLAGKWHLGTSDGTCQDCAPDQGGLNAPGEAGFDEFDALLLENQFPPFDELEAPYFHFTITSDGDPNPEVEYDAEIGEPGEDESIYNTSQVISDAVAWIESQSDPYFAFIQLFAAHGPWDCPRTSAESPYPSHDFECDGSTADTDSQKYRSMIETASLGIEDVIDALDPNDDTIVILTTDNGTPAGLEVDPWNPNKVKGTVFQGGVLVPVIFWGDGVEQGETIEHSISLVDLYATVLDLAEKDTLIPNDVDAKSLADLVTGTVSTRPHQFNYSETFFPNFEPGTGFGPCSGQQAVQEDPGKYASATYKYVRDFGAAQEGLYDLDTDQDESDNLISSPPDSDRLEDLEDHIDSTLQSDLASLCDTVNKGETGDPCNNDSDCCSNNCSNSVCVCEL